MHTCTYLWKQNVNLCQENTNFWSQVNNLRIFFFFWMSYPRLCTCWDRHPLNCSWRIANPIIQTPLKPFFFCAAENVILSSVPKSSERQDPPPVLDASASSALRHPRELAFSLFWGGRVKRASKMEHSSYSLMRLLSQVSQERLADLTPSGNFYTNSHSDERNRQNNMFLLKMSFI